MRISSSHLKKTSAAGLLAVLLLVGGVAQAGTDLNEVGAFLVYPFVAAVGYDNMGDIETFITITNASNDAITAHVSYINGDYYDYDYCYECNFDVPLTGNDTETLVISYSEYGITIESEDSTISRACPHEFGFLTVNVEDPATGEVRTDNILLGSEVVIDYYAGTALSIPAVPFQGKNGGSGDRLFDFDDNEYGKLPRVIAADFLAGNDDNGGYTDFSAGVALFTLGFDRQFPPLTDCSVTGYDAHENPFSRSFQFGCWTYEDLCEDVDPEFCYPHLGIYGNYDTHGWLQLNCRVDQDYDGHFDANGGVHGAIIQHAEYDTKIRRGDESAPYLHGNASWGRLMYQSVTTGDAVSLELEGPTPGLD